MKIVEESISFERKKDPKKSLLGIRDVPEDGKEFVGWVLDVIQTFSPEVDPWDIYELVVHEVISDYNQRETFINNLLKDGVNTRLVYFLADHLEYFDKYWTYL